jgi:TRAP-type C4-dicarboxylate transport system permease small subunit
VLIGWICAVLLIESASFVARGLTIVASAVPIKMGWVYTVMPLALLAMFLVACEAVLRLAAALIENRFNLLLSGAVPVMQQDSES